MSKTISTKTVSKTISKTVTTTNVPKSDFSQCGATTSNGARCRNPVSSGRSKYCGTHGK